MRVKTIASQQKIRAPSTKKPASSQKKSIIKEPEMTWVQMDRLIERRVKQDTKLLKVLAKL